MAHPGVRHLHQDLVLGDRRLGYLRHVALAGPIHHDLPHGVPPTVLYDETIPLRQKKVLEPTVRDEGVDLRFELVKDSLRHMPATFVMVLPYFTAHRGQDSR